MPRIHVCKKPTIKFKWELTSWIKLAKSPSLLRLPKVYPLWPRSHIRPCLLELQHHPFEKDIALRVEMRFVINESLLALKLEYFDHYHAFAIFATRNWSYIVEIRGETRSSIAAMTRCLRQAKLLYIKPILLNEEGRFLIKCLRNSSGVARIIK